MGKRNSGLSAAQEQAAIDAMRSAAISEKLTRDEFDRRVAAAKAEAREKGLKNPTLNMRVWYTIVTTHRDLDKALNQIEGEGWTLVNILPNGINSATIVCARVETLVLPELTDEADEQPVEEAAPLDENEASRETWAAETGGTQGEATAEVVEQPSE